MIPAPAFWWRDPERPGPWPRLLGPAAWLYAAATARRVARKADIRPEVPVICVGNLTAGGAGKTPTVIALVTELQRRSLSPIVVTRGYGGSERGPLRVDPRRMRAAQVGDEPLLLAAFCPVVVARDRARGARCALAQGADAIVLDDGFQNPAVARDLNLLVVDAAAGFGNGRVIPAGPLREPLAAGLVRADAIVLIGSPGARGGFRRAWPQCAGRPQLDAELRPLPTGMPWRGLRVVAFAGIGRPEKFFGTLRELGADIVQAIPLGDHQRFGPALVTRLEREARETGAQLVTTEKDAARLPAELRPKVLTLPVRLDWADPEALAGLLDALFAAGPAAP